MRTETCPRAKHRALMEQETGARGRGSRCGRSVPGRSRRRGGRPKQTGGLAPSSPPHPVPTGVTKPTADHAASSQRDWPLATLPATALRTLASKSCFHACDEVSSPRHPAFLLGLLSQFAWCCLSHRQVDTPRAVVFPRLPEAPTSSRVAPCLALAVLR